MMRSLKANLDAPICNDGFDGDLLPDLPQASGGNTIHLPGVQGRVDNLKGSRL
jgi:hypothetical protein